MPKKSAGLLIFRRRPETSPEVLLGHPGGPFWTRKDDGAWTIPKGLVETGEDPLEAARREAYEEIGLHVEGDFRWLGQYRQPGGKLVLVWAVEPAVDIAADAIVSNSFLMEWPPRSGRQQAFPENRPRQMVHAGRSRGEDPEGAASDDRGSPEPAEDRIGARRAAALQ